MGYKRLLLVEGKDDLHVISHLLSRYKIQCAEAKSTEIDDSHTIFIKITEGISSLLDNLSILLDDGDLEFLAIVVDADVNIHSRWDAVSNILVNSGSVKLPKTPSENGTVVAIEQVGRTLTVGVWLMPNNKLPGILEDFVQFLVPNDNKLLVYAKHCVANISLEDICFPEERRSKAEIHTWLAWQEHPGKPLGLAIRSRFLDAEAPQGKIFVSWIRRVFGSTKT